jgi:hypothetical protein
MIPAVFDCCWLNRVPGIFCHQHGLANIDFEYVLLSDCIKFQGTLTEQGTIVSLETADDPSIEWLDKGVIFGAKNSNLMLVGRYSML